MSRVFRSGLSRRESGSFSLRFGGAGEGENGSNEADSNSRAPLFQRGVKSAAMGVPRRWESSRIGWVSPQWTR